MPPVGTLAEVSPGLSTIRLRNCTLLLHRRRCINPADDSTFRDASLYLVSRKRVQLIDVRDPKEWAAGHLETAVNIPLAELRGRLGELDPGLPVLAICGTGRRSGKAVELLTAGGFDAEILEGGTKALGEAGVTLVGSPGEPRNYSGQATLRPAVSSNSTSPA